MIFLRRYFDHRPYRDNGQENGHYRDYRDYMQNVEQPRCTPLKMLLTKESRWDNGKEAGSYLMGYIGKMETAISGDQWHSKPPMLAGSVFLSSVQQDSLQLCSPSSKSSTNQSNLLPHSAHKHGVSRAKAPVQVIMLGFGVAVWEFRFWSLGFRVYGFGCAAEGLR